MKIISANLNGIRSAASKHFFDWMVQTGADAICVQELRAQESDMSKDMLMPEGYKGYFHCAQRKGYSGVGIYTRHQPQQVVMGLGNEDFDAEARYIRLDFEHVTVVSVYVPSGSSGEERQSFKFRFLDEFFPFLQNLLNEKRQVILCGDWNIAHCPIDLKNWKGNLKNSGFLPEERAWLDKLYAHGWVDVFRQLLPQAEGDGYTWWSNRGQAYAKNVGWRIDLQVATSEIASRAIKASVYKEHKFSDHAPLVIEYDTPI